GHPPDARGLRAETQGLGASQSRLVKLIRYSVFASHRPWSNPGAVLCCMCMSSWMRYATSANLPNENHRFKPPRFVVYYLQRLFIWGEWSISSARYYHRRDLARYQHYQAQRTSEPDDK